MIYGGGVFFLDATERNPYSLICYVNTNTNMKVLLCAIAKCENHYLREWVEWHKSLGFDNICLYDNNDPNGERFEDVIGDYIESGYVIVRDRRGQKGHINWLANNDPDYPNGYRSIQAECYDDCYHTLANDYDWMMLLDIDEFLQFEDPIHSIQEFVDDPTYDRYQYVHTSVVLFDDNDLITSNGNYSLQSRFTRIAQNDALSHLCKPIIRTRMHHAVINSAHGFSWNSIFQEDNDKFIQGCTTIGQPFVKGGFVLQEYNFKKAWIKHFIFKTLEEYIDNKQKRGWPDSFGDNDTINLDIDYFFDCNKVTQAKLDYLKDRGINYIPKKRDL